MWQFKEITSKIFKRKTVFYDNFIFRCFYRGTFWILIVGSLLVTWRHYVKEHIHCMADPTLKNVINTYCFFSSTFTVVKHHGSKIVAHPGVGPVQDDDQVTYHSYYQWVPFVLFGQALCFYLPYFIWKRNERGVMSRWCTQGVPTEEVTLRLLIHRNWSRWLVTCELLNAFNLVLQVYFTNLFLQGKFMDLGYNYTDLESVFPKVTKCTWRQYGASGTIQNHDALCVVALNLLNEKIFIVLWYWYIILITLSFIGLSWRLFTLIFHNSLWLNALVFSSIGSGANLKPYQYEKIAISTTFSEWLLVYYLGKNLKQKEFLSLIAGLGPQTFIPTTNKSLTDLNKAENYYSDEPLKSENNRGRRSYADTSKPGISYPNLEAEKADLENLNPIPDSTSRNKSPSLGEESEC